MITYSAYATPDAPNWWPNKLPEAVLDYALDIVQTIDPTTDTISSVSFAIAPSGAGEIVASGLTFVDQTISVTLTGGVPSRIYTYKVLVTMTDSRIFEFLVYQGIPPGLPGYPVPVPPSPGFGTPITSS